MITFSDLKIGGKYDRIFLAEKWGYKGFRAISRGIVTPSNANKIVLFVTKIKQKRHAQYVDNFDPITGILDMEGETNYINDERIISSRSSDDKVYLFYREIHHSDFQYYGRVYLLSYSKDYFNNTITLI